MSAALRRTRSFRSNLLAFGSVIERLFSLLRSSPLSPVSARPVPVRRSLMRDIDRVFELRKNMIDDWK